MKLAVGVEDIGHLRRIQAGRSFSRGGALVVPGMTRHMPRRRAEVLDGGSMYWVIKGLIRVRQRIVDLETDTDEEGRSYCRLIYDPLLVATRPVPQRPHQGWRYLAPERAPPDRPAGTGDDDLPEHLSRELRALGLL